MMLVGDPFLQIPELADCGGGIVELLSNEQRGFRMTEEEMREGNSREREEDRRRIDKLVDKKLYSAYWNYISSLFPSPHSAALPQWFLIPKT